MESNQPSIDVLHLSSVHPYDDTRIRWRYCEATVNAGYAVALIAPVKKAATSAPPPYYHDVVSSARAGLVGRVVRAVAVALAAIRLRARVVHFHDPELLPLAPLMRLAGSVVIYDVHEDVERQIDLKTWLHPVLRRTAKWAVRQIYSRIERFVDGVVIVNSDFAVLFNTNQVVVQRNLPTKEETGSFSYDRKETRLQLGWSESTQIVLYVGTINPSRGLTRLADTVGRISCRRPIKLVVAGTEMPTRFLTEHVRDFMLDSSTELLGQVDRRTAVLLMSGADVGTSLLDPTDTYRSALPTKLPEYSTAGLPILASNFILCEEFIQRRGSGLTCDPLDEQAIEKTLDELWDRRNHFLSLATERRSENEGWEQDFLNVFELYDDCERNRGLSQSSKFRLFGDANV